METLKSILIGIIQGLTEFLPVSSSGHIELFKEIFDYSPENGLLFTLVLHLATALSTVVVFRKDLQRLFKGLFQFKNNEQVAYTGLIVLSMIPAALVGLFLNDQIEALFDRNVLLVGMMLLLTAGVLFWSDRIPPHSEGDLNIKRVSVMGIVQAIAIMPGISRSGSTIGAGVIAGVSRVKAAGFSFIMVLPLIFGASAKEVMDAGSSAFGGPEGFGPDLLAGFVAAFVAGVFACRWMIQLVKNSRLSWFAWYCVLVGSISIVYALFVQ